MSVRLAVIHPIYALAAVAALTHLAAAAQIRTQDTAAPQTFEVAAVKPGKGDGPTRVTGPAPQEFAATNMTARGLIAAAFGSAGRPLLASEIDGAVEWIDADRFDIIAKAHDVLTPARALVMLRSLLTDRFGLAYHYRTDERPVYALLVVRRDARLGQQLRPSSVTEADCQKTIAAHAAGEPLTTGIPPCSLRVSTARDTPAGQAPEMVMTGRSVTMGQVVDRLGGFPQLTRPVIDRTGLEGRFDLDLRWAPPGRAGADGQDSGAPIGSSAPLFQALEQQLGVKLDATRGPVSILVIDRVMRPTLD